jgi:DNA-binding NarL/FixJ family response regulator
MPAEIRLLLVDDHALVRHGLRLALEQEPDLTVVGEAGDAETGLALLDTLAPDLVLLDVHLPGMSGVEATARFRAHRCAPRVLILTSYDDDRVVEGVLRRGAAGYLLKHASHRELVDAVRSIAAGDAALAPPIARKVLAHFQAGPAARTHAGLSERQLEILRLVAAGLSNGQIADTLCLSVRTVGNHVSAIYEKLRLEKRADAIRYAINHGLIAEPLGLSAR